MNLYSLRNYFTSNGAVWLKLNGSDLENMISKIIDEVEKKAAELENN